MNDNDELAPKNPLIFDIKEIITSARQNAYTAVNSAMVKAYWEIGKRIVEEEQEGEAKADYGLKIIPSLAKALTAEFGPGFSSRYLQEFRKFYLTFKGNNKKSPIWNTVCSKLSWSHIRRIIKVKSLDARDYYITEAAEQNWSVRTLDRNISSLYYDRLLLSPKEDEVKKEMLEKTEKLQDNKEFIKSPSVLEFLDLPSNIGYTEAELEKSIITNIQKFLLELGKGYAFVDRQKLIRTEARDYYIDLVFYNYILKCFVLIDLKTTRINHQDVGQMDMYVRMCDENEKSEDDNPTLGIVLCSETDQDIARYSILRGNEQIFASKYKLYLPTEEALRAEIEREKLNLKLQLDQDTES